MKPLLTPKDLSILGQLLNSEISNINRGGCCVVASMIAPLLDRHFPTRIRVFGWDYEETAGIDLTDVHKELTINNTTEWNKKGVFFSHVVVEFTHRRQTYQMDTDRVHRCKDVAMYPEYVAYDGDLSFQAAIDLANDCTGWNRAFNRGDIPHMQQIIHTFFEGFRSPRKRITNQTSSGIRVNPGL